MGDAGDGVAERSKAVVGNRRPASLLNTARFKFYKNEI